MYVVLDTSNARGFSVMTSLSGRSIKGRNLGVVPKIMSGTGLYLCWHNETTVYTANSYICFLQSDIQVFCTRTNTIHYDKIMYCFESVCDWIPRKENDFTADIFNRPPNVYKIYRTGSAVSDVQRNTSKMVTWTPPTCLAGVEQELPPRKATSRKLTPIVTSRDTTAQLDMGHNALQDLKKTLTYRKVCCRWLHRLFKQKHESSWVDVSS